VPGYTEIGICFGMILIISGISIRKKHGLEKDFLIGSVRTFLQLILLGYILNWIFKNDSFIVILLISVVMTVNSALHSRSRIQIKYKTLLLDNFLSTALTIWPLALIGSALLHATPLWKVEIFLPLLGMLLGNTLNGISVGVDFFGTELKSKKEEIISLIALGANKKEATAHVIQRSLKIAMMPTLNSMASMGIVSIPGMMTGQILAGNTPGEAAITQVILMLLIAVGTYSGTYLALAMTRRHKFTKEGIPCFE
jgi:putative ABC transport system permease protein